MKEVNEKSDSKKKKKIVKRDGGNYIYGKALKIQKFTRNL